MEHAGPVVSRDGSLQLPNLSSVDESLQLPSLSMAERREAPSTEKDVMVEGGGGGGSSGADELATYQFASPAMLQQVLQAGQSGLLHGGGGGVSGAAGPEQGTFQNLPIDVQGPAHEPMMPLSTPQLGGDLSSTHSSIQQHHTHTHTHAHPHVQQQSIPACGSGATQQQLCVVEDEASASSDGSLSMASISYMTALVNALEASLANNSNCNININSPISPGNSAGISGSVSTGGGGFVGSGGVGGGVGMSALNSSASRMLLGGTAEGHGGQGSVGPVVGGGGGEGGAANGGRVQNATQLLMVLTLFFFFH